MNLWSICIKNFKNNTSYEAFGKINNIQFTVEHRGAG